MAKVIPSHKVFKENELLVHDGDGNVISRITNLAITIIAGFDPGTTAWAMTFNTKNNTQSKQDRGNVALIVDFINDQGGAVPIPDGRGVAVAGWRMHCFYGNEGDRRFDGVINVPYDEFVELVHDIKVHHTRMDGDQGGC